MVKRWPLAGRHSELALITENVSGGAKPAGIVISGAAGVGKTRLAREALAARSRAGCFHHWIVGTASARVLPLGAFRHLAPTAGEDVSDPGLQARRLGVALTNAARSGLIVAIDDAHLLDEVSALLVLRLAVDGQVPLLITVRSGEQAPDAITTLWKDGYLTRLDLPPLSEAETTTLLESALAGHIASGSAHRLYTVSKGNALVLRELVDGAIKRGDLRRASGLWQWHGAPTVTPVLSDLIDTRVSKLKPEVYAVLELLALSEPLEVTMLGEVTDPWAVELAEQLGLITVEQDGRRMEARCAHPLYSEALRARTATLRARRLRGQVADALRTSGERRTGDLLRRAVLVLESDRRPEPELFTVAAAQALALYDEQLARRLASAAVDAGAGVPAAAALGHALSWQNRPAEAEEVLAPLDTDERGDAERAMVAIPRAANLFWTCDKAADGERVLNAAIEVVGDDAWRAELTSMGLLFRLFRNRPGEVVTEGVPLVAGLAAQGKPLPWGAAAVAIALAVTGRTDAALDTIETQLSVIERDPHASFHRATLAHAEVMALRLAGRSDDAQRAAHRELPLSLTATWAPYLVSTLRGQAALDLDRPATAVALLREAAVGLADHDPARWRFSALCCLTQAHATLGAAKQAKAALAEAEAEYRGCHALHEPDLLLARAWVAAAEGSISAARRLAIQAAHVARAAGQSAVEAVAAHTAVRFGSRDLADRLAALSLIVDDRGWVKVAAAHARALAADEVTALDAVSVDFEHVGRTLFAADAAAHAAAAGHRRGTGGQAIAAAARAARLAAQADDARTPALRASARPLPVTEREREIIELAATGLSNRAIAERLHVSIRTVEGHIYRAASKVDAANRAALVALVSGATSTAPAGT